MTGPGGAPANNSLSYSQPIDLSSLLKTGGLGQYNAAASQDLKSAIGIGGGKSAGGDYSGGPSLSYSSGSSPYNAAGSSVQLSSVPGSAFSPIKPAAVTNGSGDRGKALPRARLPPPSRIPSSAVEMPGAGQDSALSNLDVQFGGMDLQFGAGSGGSEAASGLDFNAAPGQESHGLDSAKYGHSITSSGESHLITAYLPISNAISSREGRRLVQSIIISSWICEGSQPKSQLGSLGSGDQAEWRQC